jgi:hypothetical protein
MRRFTSRVLALVMAVATVAVLSAGTADARSIRYFSGYTGDHTHWTWAGPSVGVIAWTTSTDFSGLTPCGSSWAGLEVDAAWNSESLHNGAQLDMLFSVQRSDGRRIALRLFKISKAEPWPGHPAFGGQFHVSVWTPRGEYLKYGIVTTWIVNSGVPYGPAGVDTVKFSQSTRSC